MLHLSNLQNLCFEDFVKSLLKYLITLRFKNWEEVIKDFSPQDTERCDHFLEISYSNLLFYYYQPSAHICLVDWDTL